MTSWKPWKWSLPGRIIAGLLLGAVLGLVARELASREWMDPATLSHAVDTIIQPIGQIFLRIIFMVVLPLIVAAIMLGIWEMGDLRSLGRVGVKCLGMTLLLASTSVVIGLLVVNTFKPGEHLAEEEKAELREHYAGDARNTESKAQQKRPIHETLLNLIPKNPLAEAAAYDSPNYTGGGMLAVMLFAVAAGIAMTVCDKAKMAPLVSVLEAVFALSLKIIDFAMWIAPVCVGCLGFVLTARLGAEIVGTLGWYVFAVVFGLALHLFGTYSLVLALMARKNPLHFFRQSREAIVTAFSTSSSNATLPVAMRVAEENLKLPPRISRFVLTVGASANQNGTALYEGITVIFLAQVFGPDLTLPQQLTVALMCILAGVGTAGVPGGSLPLVVGVLVAIGTPPDSIALIIGIDRILDMCRTTLNVTGDLVCATVVARGEAAEPPET
jgi:DAACS family dicarboxylate/amino acid:cation (Na+ or H+) symporter